MTVWITRRPDDEVATELKASRGPLAGARLAVKDNVNVAGLPTTAACPEFAYTPDRDAAAVAALRAAGAVVVGKTNLDQFATGLVGTRSPYGAVPDIRRREYISGGSSSGSAVAVAKGEADIAIGTDTAGSGRVPAGLQGIVGIKPTVGVISTDGVVPASESYDCVTIFAPSTRTREPRHGSDGGRGKGPCVASRRPARGAAQSRRRSAKRATGARPRLARGVRRGGRCPGRGGSAHRDRRHGAVPGRGEAALRRRARQRKICRGGPIHRRAP